MIAHDQKVLVHFNRLLKGARYPVCAEIHPTSLCPHDCVWCYNKAERNSNPRQIVFADVARILPDMVDRGLKAVQITGGGEPLVYRHADDLFELCNKLGLEVGLETSGELMHVAFPHLANNWKYVRFSLDAYDKASYVRTRGVTERRDWGKVYDTVIVNLRTLIDLKRNSGATYRVVLGYVVHQLNYDEQKMIVFFDECEVMGVDLIQIRPDFTDPESARFSFDEIMKSTRAYKNLKITVSTKVVRPYGYGYCYGSMLSTVLYYTNKMVACCMRPNVELGDLSEPFETIWKRAVGDILEIDTDRCPPCRFHNSNVLLNNLMDMDNHINML